MVKISNVSVGQKVIALDPGYNMLQPFPAQAGARYSIFIREWWVLNLQLYRSLVENVANPKR